MAIRNIEKDALSSNISLTDFGKAMNQVDLSLVPPEKRRLAIFDHMMRIMADTVTDGTKATEIRQARLGRMLQNR
ncbi:MAG: hypothetical protein EBR05_08745 [Marivivens sp.]|jgi:hypothetical protein|nr:hypothetical protein [Marivivens sp.]NBT50558.1 hypothetical protein [Marivivens sp.]NBX09883.1 hypothetical protein [Marivivens sp.]NCW69687.1 hypothetical protein [Marivivens sp.]NDH02269.1 hypothetical protein [Marivivens sp.]